MAAPVTPDISTPLLKQRMAAVFKRLPGALSGEEEDVHQVRVAARRLRVWLPLLAKKPGKRAVKRATLLLRDLTRAAGASRDLDVVASLFDQSQKGHEVPPVLVTLRRRLLAARTRSRARTADALFDLEIAQLRRDLRKALHRKGEGFFTVFARLRATRDALGEELLTGFREIGAVYEPDRLHHLRIRARRLRYLGELSDTLRGQSSGGPEIFKELQNRLGDLHDSYVLSLWFGRQALSSARRGQEEIAAAAQAQCATWLETSRTQHTELLTRNPIDLVLRGLEALGATRPAA
jgi:CHAD domain-containing protein